MSAAKRNAKTLFDSDEEESGAVRGKADRALGALKGLFARRRDEDEDEYDYEDYDDYEDDYDDDPGAVNYIGPAGASEDAYADAQTWEQEGEIYFDEDSPYGDPSGEGAYDWSEEEQTEAEAFAALSAMAGGAAVNGETDGFLYEGDYAPESAEEYGAGEYGEEESDEVYPAEEYGYGEEGDFEEEWADGAYYGAAYAAEEAYAPAEDSADYAEAYDPAEEDFYGELADGDYYDDPAGIAFETAEDGGYYDEPADSEAESVAAPAADAYTAVDNSLRAKEETTAEEDYFREFENWEDYEDYPQETFMDRLADKLRPLLIPALAVVAALALGVSVFAAVTLWGGKGSDKNTEAVTALPALPPTSAELQATGQAQPEPVQPSAPVVEVKAQRNAAGALIPTGSTAVVPLRSQALELDAFAKDTHIGNSFVEGMQLWSDIDTQYVCADGVSLDNMIGNYLYYVTVRNYDNIYLTLGINEIGWPVDSFISKYEKVIDYIRSDSTDKTKGATIYITSVFPTEKIMETQAGESGSPIHKDTILQFNEELKAMCLRKGCWYLDVYSELAGPDGYLPEEVAADDHVHFEKTGYRIWTDYLCNHYVDDSFIS